MLCIFHSEIYCIFTCGSPKIPSIEHKRSTVHAQVEYYLNGFWWNEKCQTATRLDSFNIQTVIMNESMILNHWQITAPEIRFQLWH